MVSKLSGLPVLMTSMHCAPVHIMLATHPVLALGCGRGWKAGSLQHQGTLQTVLQQVSGESNNKPEHNIVSMDMQYYRAGVPAG